MEKSWKNSLVITCMTGGVCSGYHTVLTNLCLSPLPHQRSFSPESDSKSSYRWWFSSLLVKHASPEVGVTFLVPWVPLQVKEPDCDNEAECASPSMCVPQVSPGVIHPWPEQQHTGASYHCICPQCPTLSSRSRCSWQICVGGSCRTLFYFCSLCKCV